MYSNNLILDNFIVNPSLLTAIEVIRRENPEYDVQPVKVATSIESTQYPDGRKINFIEETNRHNNGNYTQPVKIASLIESTQYPDGRKVSFKSNW